MYQPQFPYGINNLGIWRNAVLFHRQGGEILLDLYSKIYFRLKILSRFHRTRKGINQNCITKSDHFFKPGMLHVQAILKTNKDFLCHHRANLDLFKSFSFTNTYNLTWKPNTLCNYLSRLRNNIRQRVQMRPISINNKTTSIRSTLITHRVDEYILVLAKGGCAWSGGVCLVRGGMSCPGGWCLLRGACSRGVSAPGVSTPGGVCSGGCLLGGCAWSGGVSAPGGWVSASVPCEIPPCEQNDKQVQNYYLGHNCGR